MRSKAESGFIRWSFASIISLLLLILAGGIVRSSGSGMGCPDWPRCFNRYIPPTNVSELPADYKESFLKARLKKNIHAAHFFEWLGYRKLAADIRSDPAIGQVESFNVWNTYTEYINRLASVLVGIFFLVAWAYSFAYWKKARGLVVIWTLGLVLIGFQGWLGSIVVSTNLFAWLITLHMLLALLILVLAIGGFTWATGLQGKYLNSIKSPDLFNGMVVLLILLVTVQILTGTQVREKLDIISMKLQHQHRDQWISGLSEIFNWHIYLSIAASLGVLVTFLVLYYSGKQQHMIFKIARINLFLVGIQMLTGTILAGFALPPFTQALHIFVASLIFGNLVYIFLLGSSRSNEIRKSRELFRQIGN